MRSITSLDLSFRLVKCKLYLLCSKKKRVIMFALNKLYNIQLNFFNYLKSLLMLDKKITRVLLRFAMIYGVECV